MSYNRNWNVQISGEAQRNEVTALRKSLGATDKILFNALWKAAMKNRNDLEFFVNTQLSAKETAKETNAVAALERKLKAAKAKLKGDRKPKVEFEPALEVEVELEVPEAQPTDAPFVDEDPTSQVAE